MGNDDKVYNLLEKVYIEVQDTKQKVNGIEQRVTGIEQRVTGIEQRVTGIDKKLTKVELIIENEIKPNIKGLYETQSQILDKLEEHDKRFDSIETKLEKHDVEIRVIKAAK